MRKIKICSQEWDFYENTKDGESEFHTFEESGRGSIKVTVYYPEKRLRAEVLLHEIIESILSVDNKRWKDEATQRILFCFDHDYFNDELCKKIVDALCSVGKKL